MNQYPLWKYILIWLVIGICTLYSLPNLFGEDPALQISAGYARDVKIDEDTALKASVETRLKEANIDYISFEATPTHLLYRFKDTDTQLKAYSLLEGTLPGYVVAQNLAPVTPMWLTKIGAKPMFLGLDLRGGVHFLMEIDMKAAIQRDEEQLVNELRGVFREKKLHYQAVNRAVELGGGIYVTFPDSVTRNQAQEFVSKDYTNLNLIQRDEATSYGFYLAFKEMAIKEIRQQALEQNITTLRNRVNELGVAEPIIQQQGDDRIVVQLPGVQDTTQAKEILGATATLEFRLVAPPEEKLNARSYKRREGGTVMLRRNVIVTGNEITSASAGVDQQTGLPAAMVRLDSKGAKKMLQTTRENVHKPMAVVFIEYKTDTQLVAGKKVRTRQKIEEVVNVATIQEEFGKNFQITGLTSGEARNLALLLRAGALSAPMEIVEERTIGPSLGQKNIEQGSLSIFLGFVAVMVFMVARYRIFGLIADFALMMNFIILVALLSLLQATLTLPGMAGIALTLGMAVDANVLIYERIREEIANKNTPQASIHAGFEKAFGTIFDSNITTLIAALMLFSFGTGPIKGFAITLSLGITTSMFTAVMVSRAVVNYFYGGRNLTHLPV